MGSKNQNPNIYNWQSADPTSGFLPQAYPFGSIPSGVVQGVMTGTNVIFSNIVDLSRMDNVGLEVNWTGDPTGTFEVQGSNSGKNFYSLTFDPALAQPTGAAGGYLVDLSGYPFKFILLKYTNDTGAGLLSVYGQNKDLN